MTSYKNIDNRTSTASNPMDVSVVSGNEDSFLCKNSALNHSFNLPISNLDDLNESRLDTDTFKDTKDYSNGFKSQKDPKEASLRSQIEANNGLAKSSRSRNNGHQGDVMSIIAEVPSSLQFSQSHHPATKDNQIRGKQGIYLPSPISPIEVEENKGGMNLETCGHSPKKDDIVLLRGSSKAVLNNLGRDEEAKMDDASRSANFKISEEENKSKSSDSNPLKLSSEKTKMKPKTPLTSPTSEKTCKICLETTHDEISGSFIHPCKCIGSVSYIHEGCLKTWIQSKGIKVEDAHCELCKTKYKMKFSYKLKFYPKGALNKGVASLISSLCLLGMIIGLFILIISVVTSKDLNSTTPNSSSTSSQNGQNNQYGQNSQYGQYNNLNQTLAQQAAIQAQKNRSAKLVIGLLCTVFIVILSLLFCYTFKEAFFISNIEQWKIENYGGSDSRRKMKFSNKKPPKAISSSPAVELRGVQNIQHDNFSIQVQGETQLQNSPILELNPPVNEKDTRRCNHKSTERCSCNLESSNDTELSIRTDLYYCDGNQLFYENFNECKKCLSVPNIYSGPGVFEDESFNLDGTRMEKSTKKLETHVPISISEVKELNHCNVLNLEFMQQIKISSKEFTNKHCDEKLHQIKKATEDDCSRSTTIRGS